MPLCLPETDSPHLKQGQSLSGSVQLLDLVLVQKNLRNVVGMYRKFGQNVKKIKLTAVMTAVAINLEGFR